VLEDGQCWERAEVYKKQREAVVYREHGKAVVLQDIYVQSLRWGE
jgi:hypothetical protein